MDSVREALTLVASEADRSRLAPSETIRARGDRIKRRRAIAGTQVVLVGAVVLVAAVAWRGSPEAVRPPIDQPSPSVTAPVEVVRGSCGHGRACPEGNGPFRVVFEPNRAGALLSVDATAPAGWGIHGTSSEGVRLLGPTGSEGVAVLWPARPGSGDGTAADLARSLASLPGAATPTVDQVTVDGHAAWRVVIHQSRSGSTECVDPRFGLYTGEDFASGELVRAPGCQVLFDLAADSQDGLGPTPVGLSGHGEVEITLVDGLGLPGARPGDSLAILRWSSVGGSPLEGAAVVDGLRFGVYSDPECGESAVSVDPPCPVRTATYVFHGDPDVTASGIHAWHSQAQVQIPAGWSILRDDGRGDLTLADHDGWLGADLLWQPRGPGDLSANANDAAAWATRTAAEQGVLATRPSTTTIAGRPAWQLDLEPKPGAKPFRQSDIPYEDSRCGDGPPPFAVALMCAPAVSDVNGGFYLEGDMSARVWFVQVDEDHVLGIVVWGKPRAGSTAPAALQAALTATEATVRSMEAGVS